MNELITIANKLKSINRHCYVVGSFCVSKILGKSFEGDIDLTTDATPEEIITVLKVVGEIGKKYGTLIIKEGDKRFEITTFRKDIGSINHRRPIEVVFTDSLAEDASRRDFTMNAIYYDILSDSFIDPTGGIIDLQNNIIRFVGDINMRLDEDILRLLRYIRFQFAYGFTPASTGYDGIIKKRLGEIQDISIQRIRQEFDKILIHPSNIEALRYLKEIDFFKIFLPEVNILSEISGGPKHHLEGNVWEHTLLVIQSLNQLSLKPDQKLLLYWTAILHDIGKYETYSNDINGEVHYYNHEKVGAALTKEVAKKWKFSTKLSKDIEWLIRHHLYPQKLVEMKKLKVNTLMIHPLFPVLISLSFADGHGKIPAYILPRKKIMQQHETFLEKYHTTKFFTGKAIVEKYPELSGVDIGKKINELNTQILAKL